MKTLVIYTSFHHGNTKKIAEKIASTLNADLLEASKVKDVNSLKKYDLIGFGSGMYYFKHHKSLLNLVDKLPVMGKKAFVFYTSGGGSLMNSSKPLTRRLSSKGFEIIAEFSCRGWDTYGLLKFIGGLNKNRPNEKDLNKAEKFAGSLKKKIDLL